MSSPAGIMDKWIRFSIPSTMQISVLTGHEFFEERVPCMVWGRWLERTGVLWLECVVCDEAMFGADSLNAEQMEEYNDQLLEELCRKHF